MTHVRTAPYYSQSDGKLERYQKTIKSDAIRPGQPGLARRDSCPRGILAHGFARVRCQACSDERVARARGIPAPRTGAITFAQRFGGLGNLNVHFHLLVPGGVFAQTGTELRSRYSLRPPAATCWRSLIA